MKKRLSNGFTLLETMLVLAIVGGILVLAINYSTRQLAQHRRDKTALQVQQVLTAGLAYYTSYGTWPVSCVYNSSSTSNSAAWSNLSSLTSTGYLPSSLSANSFGYGFAITCDSVTNNVFYVVTRLSNTANALVVAGELPVAYLSDQYGNPSSTGPYVTAQVTTPGQNLNNARSVNFSGIYHNGACIPVPSCPGYNPTTNACANGTTNCMTPQIMVAPVSASGVNDPGSTSIYPIASFTAYAYGPSTTPRDCPTGSIPTACTFGTNGIQTTSGVYWRICLQVITQKGVVSTTNMGTGTSAWGQYASLMVITRCTPPNEPYGSDFTVFTQ